MNTSPNNFRYILYARKSSESEDRQIQSIDDQINKLQELSSTNKLKIIDIITESKSAKKPDNRPLFDEMLNRIERGEADGILCWQINRLSRNPIDSGRLGWMLQQNILKSIRTYEKEYLPEDNVLLFNIESGQANQFIIDLKKNSIRGMEGKADRGWLPSGAPIGYKNDKLEHTIIPDSERFDLVRKMFDLMLTGNYTGAKILRIANNKWGFKTPKSKRSGGVKLSLSGIYRIFNNIFYTGDFKWRGQIYKGIHTPMITHDEFDRVQLIMGGKGKPRPQTHEFAYTGMLRCGYCNSMYTATERVKLLKSGELKKYIYYHCTRKKKDIPCPKKSSIKLEKLETMMRQEIMKYTILPEFKEWALEILNSNNDKEIKERTDIQNTQQKSISSLQSQLDNLTRMRYRELIDDETFLSEKSTLLNDLQNLRIESERTTSRAENWLSLTENVFKVATNASNRFAIGSLEEKRDILSSIGSNFLIKEGKLSLLANNWLLPIETQYPELESELNRLELDKNLTVEARESQKQDIILRWGGYRESNPNWKFHKLQC